MSGAAADQQMTAEVQVVFKTNLPEDFQVPDVQINISASSTAKELTQIVKQMLSEEGKVEEDVLKGKKFNFMIENVFVTGTVQELIDKQGKGGEETIEVYYTFALDKPKPSKSIPQDEWICTVKSLSHILNEKAKTYIVGFFNGDLKVFDKGTHAELYSVKQLHQDNIIEDALFLKNDVLDKKLIVTAGAKPTAELKISELSHSMVGGAKAYQFQTIAQSKDELNGSESFGCLSNNPLNNQFICSSGPIIHQEDGAGVHEQGILIWKLDQNILKKDALPQKLGAPTKRVRTDAVQEISPHAKIHCSGGISSLKWSGPGKIFAGCNDHSLKLVNVERQQIEEILFTQHKVPTALDASKETSLISGHEDGIVRLWDVRSGSSSNYKSQFDSHSKWISQVRFNPTVDNIFLSASYDGTVKLWDLRNAETPLATLKKKEGGESYKVFAVEWNGPSQIVSGGSDSQVSVHTIGKEE
ncbi:hypothetical protein FGO68_gene6698 [Halteria grandinella]|uniref:NLE domain-containing protein n=1 Tax=Halteria grandinella TaxID=5974 RepID=A0A8J8T2A2_HALGN|nr:hypothetical protein FGO68_gene6698 [Halteria grandinella]